jgi:hypothetical protein
VLFRINQALKSDIKAIAADNNYDAVIIGSGVAGAIIVSELVASVLPSVPRSGGTNTAKCSSHLSVWGTNKNERHH